MANWGGLNPALNAWRNGINRRLSGRDFTTDGARADKNHGSTSQHQEDADGTVDAFDMDTNLLASSTPAGTATERRLIDAMKLDFEQDPHGRGYLWIANREIASADVGNWAERAYSGDSPHTEHVHWQSRQSREHIGSDWPMPNLDAALRELGLGGEGDMLVRKGDAGEDVRFWQYVLGDLGYGPVMGAVDGEYGPKMETAVNAHRKALGQGPLTSVSGYHGFAMLREMMNRRAGKPGEDGLPGKDGVDGKDGVLTGTLAITGGTLTATAQ